MKAKPKACEAEIKERNERLVRGYDAEVAERQRYAITDEELDAILLELIERLDGHMVQSAWNFKDNLSWTEGEWSNEGYLEQFIERLDPCAEYLINKIQAGLLEHYPNDLPSNPSNDFYHLLSTRQECAYVVGVFMGAKLAGASPKTLELLRKHLVL